MHGTRSIRFGCCIYTYFHWTSAQFWKEIFKQSLPMESPFIYDFKASELATMRCMPRWLNIFHWYRSMFNGFGVNDSTVKCLLQNSINTCKYGSKSIEFTFIENRSIGKYVNRKSIKFSTFSPNIRVSSGFAVKATNKYNFVSVMM